MSQELGKIAVKKVPASEAVAGNAEHAKLMSQATKPSGKPHDSNWASGVRTTLAGPAIFGAVVLIASVAGFGY